MLFFALFALFGMAFASKDLELLQTHDCPDFDGFMVFPDLAERGGTCTDTAEPFINCVVECESELCEAFDYSLDTGSCCIWSDTLPENFLDEPGMCTYIRSDDVIITEDNPTTPQSIIVPTIDGMCIHAVEVSGHRGIYSDIMNGIYEFQGVTTGDHPFYIKDEDEVQVAFYSSPLDQSLLIRWTIGRIVSEQENSLELDVLAFQDSESFDELGDDVWIIIDLPEDDDDDGEPFIDIDAEMEVGCATINFDNVDLECPYGILVSDHDMTANGAHYNGIYQFITTTQQNRPIYYKDGNIDSQSIMLITSIPAENTTNLFTYVIFEQFGENLFPRLQSPWAVEHIDEIPCWLIFITQRGETITYEDCGIEVECYEGGEIDSPSEPTPPVETPTPPFTCDHGRKTLLNYRLCDGTQDCSDGTDELPENCPSANPNDQQQREEEESSQQETEEERSEEEQSEEEQSEESSSAEEESPPMQEESSQNCSDDSSWESDFGPCTEYGPGGLNEGYCKMDTDRQGVFADDVCMESCGHCPGGADGGDDEGSSEEEGNDSDDDDGGSDGGDDDESPPGVSLCCTGPATCGNINKDVTCINAPMDCSWGQCK